MQKTRPSGLSWVICFRLCVKPMKAVFRLGKRGKRSPRPQRVEVLPRLYAGPSRLRSEERRVGEECVSKCRSRWSPDHKKKKYEREHISEDIVTQTEST